jgi:glycerol transport system substrate-binding protein
VPAQGNIAQQIFWYTAFTADMVKPGLPVVNADGTPKWRMAPSPKGAYWRDGMKLGYQDAGSWTLLRSTPVDRRRAAWLYAQFCVAKSTSLKKSHVGLTFIRESDIWHESFTGARAQPRRARGVLPLPGAGAVDADGREHPGLSAPRAALVAEHRRRVLRRAHAAAGDGRAGGGAGLGAGAAAARERPGRVRPAPQPAHQRGGVVRARRAGRQHRPAAALANEKPQGETVDYDTLIRSWPATPPRRS